KDYHIDLRLEISDDGTTDAKRKKFRYQITGAHGLPIEGEWYTLTYRNAIIGLVDKSNSLWRTFEGASKISHLKGGSRVPATTGSSDAVQYAAVATQNFTSARAVSDKQESGIDARGILAYARPTHESEEKLCFLDSET